MPRGIRNGIPDKKRSLIRLCGKTKIRTSLFPFSVLEKIARHE
jgi:hypothetical protein